jgi:phage tail tape-measure protein
MVFRVFGTNFSGSGVLVGSGVGVGVGVTVGSCVGSCVGSGVGDIVGSDVGVTAGSCVGVTVGSCIGVTAGSSASEIISPDAAAKDCSVFTVSAFAETVPQLITEVKINIKVNNRVILFALMPVYPIIVMYPLPSSIMY